MLTLAGRGAILAGTRRVGATVAERLAAEGVKIALVYRRSLAEVTALQARIAEKGEAPLIVQADLGVEDDVRRAVNEAVVVSFLAFGAFNYVFTQTLLATHPQIVILK